MNYLIAVCSNRIQAEAAYKVLEKEGLPSEQISILGNGYKNIDEYGLLKFNYQAKNKNNIQRLAYWLIPFGFAIGYAFNLLMNIEIISTGGIINRIIGGLLGAASGLLGAFIILNSSSSLTVDEDALLYRDRLNAGKYLIIFQGTEESVKKATSMLHSFEIENIREDVSIKKA